LPIQFTEKWDQYGLMAELALKLKGVSPQFGKTVLQKLVYILQEIYRVPCGYDYILYRDINAANNILKQGLKELRLAI